uniref:RNA-dependent RNA polymerase n=1 Tax=Soybean thrips partiti-like virus 4 TaxID=2801006 RepID=A0A7T8IMM0_9VIRU|nr:RNA-dependent RNA polymerase [Soybean thrips partiti-like virus 4]
MPLTRLPSGKGFSQRHKTHSYPSPYLIQFFNEIPSKHRSPVTFDLIRKDLLQNSNDSKIPKSLTMKLAILEATKAFQLSSPVKMMHLNDVFKQDLNIWTSSPGLPWRDMGYKTKGDIRKDVDAVNRVRWFWHKVKGGSNIDAPDCCAFVRSHLADYGETKVRAVWGYPATMTFGEAVFAIPLQRAYEKGKYPIAYGYETAVGGTNRLVRECSRFKYKYALDFKSFDKTVPVELIDAAFNILLLNIDFMHYEDYGTADVLKNFRMFEYIKDYFINTPIRLCNGERYRKSSGVASGSYFTQLIDSIVNYILIVYLCLELNGKLPDYIKVLGDDSIFCTDKLFDLDRADELLQKFGMSLNLKKSAVSRSLNKLTFLGYQINDGIPSKPYDLWLSALLYPEEADRCWDDVASRSLGLLYACMGTDDRFDGYCRAILSLKPYSLDTSKGIFRMLRNVGIKDVSTTPPSKWGFLKRII